MRTMPPWRVPLALLCAWCCACSADMAPEPEPTLYTSGAFVAVDVGEPALVLYRTLAVLGDEGKTEALFLTRYGVQPHSYAEATELAQRHDLPASAQATVLGPAYFDMYDWRIVWFRSLSYEEQASFR